MEAMEAAGTPVTKSVASNVKYGQRDKWHPKHIKAAAAEPMDKIRARQAEQLQADMAAAAQEAVQTVAVSNGAVSLADLYAIKSVALHMGGIEHVRNLLQVLEDLGK
jgi:hypothetical protein